MKGLALGVVLLVLSGCTTLEKTLDRWESQNSRHRVYQVKTAWIRETPDELNLGFRKINRMTPLLVGPYLVQGNAIDGIAAYNRENGQKLWKQKVKNGVEPSATFIRDRVFVGASDGNFYSLEASSGDIQWSFDTKAENLSEPLLEDGVVYFISGANTLYALDAATGQSLWLYSRQDTSQISIRGGSRPTYANGKIYVGFSDGALVAFNAKDGAVAWEVQLNRGKRFRDIDASPVIDGNNIYVSGYDDKLYCVSADKGEILWRVDGGGYYPLTVLGDRLIYPTSAGEVRALKKSNGDSLWTYKVQRGIPTAVKAYKGALVFGESQGSLRFVDPQSGQSLGEFEPGRGILSTPQIDEKAGRVYFISGEANLYAIDAGWTVQPYFP